MLDEFLRGVFTSDTEVVVTVNEFLACIGVSLLTGIIFALVASVGTHKSKSFLTSIAIIPAAVCVVIMAVNGNVGAGVAVAGAFGLVRFRSLPGNARDISAIFLAMGAGLIAGMGHLAYSLLYTVIMSIALVIFSKVSESANKTSSFRSLRITIPEDLDYTSVFDDIMKEYTKKSEVLSVKTVNMGSLFRVVYNVTLKDPKKEKEFVDSLRTRNGNLEICISRQETLAGEL